MRNLKHQNGCHNCLFAHTMSCDDCGEPYFTVCLHDNDRPDTEGRCHEQLMFAENSKDKKQSEALAAWEKTHTVSPWSVCDDFMSSDTLTHPCQHILDVETAHDFFDLANALGVVHRKWIGKGNLDFLNVSMADKVRMVIYQCQQNGPPFTIRLSSFGFAVMERTLQELGTFISKREDKECLARGMTVFAKFRRV